MHGDNIEVAFNHIDTIRLGNGVLGLEDAVERLALVKEFRLRRVDVFARVFGFLHDASSESDDLACDIVERENDS